MSTDLQNDAKTRRGPWWPAALFILLGFAVAIGAIVYAQWEGASLESEALAAGGTPVATSAPPSPSTTIPDSSAAEVTTGNEAPSNPVSSASSSTSSSTTTTIYTHALPDPVRVVIPAIDVDSELIPVGILEDGFMEVPPFGLAGWYDLGPRPGDNGPAVLVAHVDTTKGPDVFYHLKDLEAGDEVMVHDSSGDVATFVVDSKEQQLKVELPVDRIWNDTQEPVIRLITCGGDFDRKSRHYLSNVIVYGHLAE